MFQGRINRTTVFVAGIALSVIGTIFDQKFPPGSSLVSLLFDIFFIILYTALDVRRFHDIGKSGYYVLYMQVPLSVYYGILDLNLGTGIGISEFLFNKYATGPILPSFLTVIFFLFIAYEIMWDIYLLFKKGDKKANKYGKVPLKGIKFW